MKFHVDLAAVRKNAEELPQRVDEIPAGLEDIYRQEGEGYVRDEEQHAGLLAEIDRLIDRESLRAENQRLREDADRKACTAAVRDGLARAGVKPQAMAAAVALFMSRHRFAVRDGEVRVIGTIGATDAEAAAVQFLATEDGDAFADRQEGGGFAAEVAKLGRRLH